MDNQIDFTMTVGLVIFSIGLLSAIVSFALLFSGPGKHRAMSGVLTTAGLGLVGFLAGSWLGVQYFCSSSDAANLCGLGGVLGTGPLAAGLALMAGSALMLKARRNAP